MSDEELLHVIKQPEKSEALRIGDHVRIKSPDEIIIGLHEDEPGYVSRMQRMGGVTTHIKKVSRKGNFMLHGIDYYWHESWLEKL